MDVGLLVHTKFGFICLYEKLTKCNNSVKTEEKERSGAQVDSMVYDLCKFVQNLFKDVGVQALTRFGFICLYEKTNKGPLFP